MRKIVLIAAITLVSATATATAGGSRGLSPISSSESVQRVPEQPQQEQRADIPTSAVERPKPAIHQRQAGTRVAADKAATAATPKKEHLSTQARVIYELHRQAIYW
jgi:hypothetical protein